MLSTVIEVWCTAGLNVAHKFSARSVARAARRYKDEVGCKAAEAGLEPIEERTTANPAHCVCRIEPFLGERAELVVPVRHPKKALKLREVAPLLQVIGR